MTDLGDRFRIVANVIDIVEADRAAAAPAGRARGLAAASRHATAVEAWLSAGGAHHTVLTRAARPRAARRLRRDGRRGAPAHRRGHRHSRPSAMSCAGTRRTTTWRAASSRCRRRPRIGGPAGGRLARQPRARRGRPRHPLVRERQRPRPGRRGSCSSSRAACHMPTFGRSTWSPSRLDDGLPVATATSGRRRTRRPISRSTAGSRRSAASSIPTRRRRPLGAGRSSDPAVRDHPCRPLPRPGAGHPRPPTEDEVAGDYEAATGRVIVETLEAVGLDPIEMPAVLVASHGPFTWGSDPASAVGQRGGAGAGRGDGEPDARPRPGCAADGALPARPPLPAQARRQRLLRPAPMTTDVAVADVARLFGRGRHPGLTGGRRRPGARRGRRPDHGGRPVRVGPALVSRGEHR